MKKIALTIVLFLGMTASVCAQTNNGAGFRISLGNTLGLSGVTVQNDYDGTFHPGFSYGADLNFYAFFNAHVGFRTGLGFSHIYSSYSYGSLTEHQSINDIYQVDYTYNVEDVSMRFNASYAQIPLQLSLLWKRWYANLGFKLALPMQTQSYCEYGNVEVSAYLPETGTSVAPGDPLSSLLGCDNYGKQTFDAMKGKNPWMVLASVDFGFRIPCSGVNNWTIGLYADYSLFSSEVENTMVKTTMNSAHQGVASVAGMPIDNLGFFAAGIKLQCDFEMNVK